MVVCVCIKLFLTVELSIVQLFPILTLGPTVALFKTTFSPIQQGSIIVELLFLTESAINCSSPSVLKNQAFWHWYQA